MGFSTIETIGKMARSDGGIKHFVKIVIDFSIKKVDNERNKRILYACI